MSHELYTSVPEISVPAAAAIQHCHDELAPHAKTLDLTKTHLLLPVTLLTPTGHSIALSSDM